MMMRRKGCDEGIREHEKVYAAGCMCVYLSTIFSFLPHLLPQFDDAAQDANEYIRVHAPLVCFVDDDDLVSDVDSKGFTSSLLEKKVVW